MIFESPELSVVICILQISFVVVIGTGLISLLINRRAQLASTAGNTIIGVMVVLTATLFLPQSTISLFNWSPLEVASTERQEIQSGRVVASAMSNPAESTMQDNAASYTRPSLFTFNLNKLRSFVMPTIKAQSIQTVIRLGAIVIPVLALLGLVRFLDSVWKLKKLISNSRVLSNDRLQKIAKQVADRIGCNCAVQFRESDAIQCAAVIGFPRPSILLSRQWQKWPDVELECVIAHEYSHIIRHDFVWRLLLCLVTKLHCFNPLVYLLFRRITLAQEMAADIIAVRCLGKQNYVDCLCKLALQQDQSNTNYAGSGIAPVFSGYLIRRIKMLNRETLDTNVTKSNLPKYCITGLLLLVGLFAFVQGSIAATQESENSNQNETQKTQPVTVSKVQPQGDMFFRPPLEHSKLARCKDGVFSVEIDELRHLIKTDEFGIDTYVNNTIATHLHDAFPSFTKPTIDISKIQTIVCDANLRTNYLKTDPLTGEVYEQPNSLSFASESGQLIMKQAFGSEDWISDFAPKSRIHKRGDQSACVLSIPAHGPAPTVITGADDDTILFSGFGLPPTDAEEAVDRMLDLAGDQTTQAESDWLPAFRRIEGGLISMLFTNAEINTPKDLEERLLPSSSDLERKSLIAAHRLEHSFETLAIGVDLSEDVSMLGLRVRIGAKSKNTAEEMLVELKAVKDYIMSEFNEDPEQSFSVYAFVFASATIGLEQTPEDTWEVVLENTVNGPIGLPQLAEWLASQLGVN